jgi:hypothetical protein
MKDTKFKTQIILTVIVIVLSAVSSFGGIFFNNLYRDNELVNAVWLGNDIVTLFLVIPLMSGALFFSLRNSVKARLILMGTLWYMVYNYLFYMYGSAFNKFFILYVFIFTLSVYALILALMEIDREALLRKIDSGIPVKWISSFMIFFAVFIGGLWIVQSLSFVFTDEVPKSITQTGHLTGVVYATDLSLLVSTLIVGASLLRKKELWGYLISIISMTKCVLYPFVLVIGGCISYKRTGIWDTFMPAYIFLWIGCLLAFGALIKGIDSKRISKSRIL